MSATDAAVIRRGRERARTGPWRGDGEVAFLGPVPDAPPPSAQFVRHCVDELAAKGVARVVTTALSPEEQDGFLAAGFVVAEHLHLLSHGLRDLPAVPLEAALRRARRADRPAVLAVDGRAFAPFWRVEAGGLDDALTATPRRRFRVATRGETVVGYAVTGRAGSRGFLQRLAVDPASQRRGVGRALVLDALHWLRQRGARRAVVNTPLGNEAALTLYTSVGFREEWPGLSVLTLGLER